VTEFSIGELARRSGYAVQTVRYYEQTGLMPVPVRTKGRQRRYGPEQLRRLLFIRHARDLGFEVEAIRSLLRLAAHPEASCDSVDAIARDHLAATTEKITRLSALRREVTRMVEHCRRSRIADCRVIDALHDWQPRLPRPARAHRSRSRKQTTQF
jgi:DNA-binding transcriptional MerR regulator